MRHTVGALCAVALVVAACSDESRNEATGAAPTVEPALNAEPASTDAAAPTAPDGSTSEATADPSSGSGEIVVLTGAQGESTVPVTSSGVFAADEATAATLLTIGVEPIAAAQFYDDVTFLPILEAAGLELIEFNLELIAAIDPELIIGLGDPGIMQFQDELGEIAPLFFPDFSQTWIEQTETLARATGREDRAAALERVIQSRIEEVRAAVADAGLEGATVSVIQEWHDRNMVAFGPITLAGDLLSQVGFERSELQASDGAFGFVPISEEFLADETSAADVIVSLSGPASGGRSIFDNPLTDVGSATAFGDAGDIWAGNNAIAAWAILHDIEVLVTGGDELAYTGADVAALADELFAAVGAT